MNEVENGMASLPSPICCVGLCWRMIEVLYHYFSFFFLFFLLLFVAVLSRSVLSTYLMDNLLVGKQQSEKPNLFPFWCSLSVCPSVRVLEDSLTSSNYKVKSTLYVESSALYLLRPAQSILDSRSIVVVLNGRVIFDFLWRIVKPNQYESERPRISSEFCTNLFVGLRLSWK